MDNDRSVIAGEIVVAEDTSPELLTEARQSGISTDPVCLVVSAYLNRARSAATRNTYAAQLGAPHECRAAFVDAPVSIRYHHGTPQARAEIEAKTGRVPPEPRPPAYWAWFPWCERNGFDPLAPTEHHLLSWLNDMNAARVDSESTRQHRYNITAAFLTWARNKGYAPRAQVLTADDKRAQQLLGDKTPELAGLTPAQTQAVRRASRWDDRTVSCKPGAATPQQRRLRSTVIVGLLHGSGLRVGELVRLNLDDYRRPKPGGPGWLIVHGKGNRIAEQVIAPGDADDLDAYLRDGRIQQQETTELAHVGQVSNRQRREAEPLITGDAGTRLQPATVTGILRRLAALPRADAESLIERQAHEALAALPRRRDGLPDIHPHQLRHASGQELLEAGGDMEDVRRHLRHANLSTTSKYMRSRQDRTEEMVTKLGSFQRRGDDLALVTTDPVTTTADR